MVRTQSRTEGAASRRVTALCLFALVLSLGAASTCPAQDCTEPANIYRQAVVSLNIKRIKKITGQISEGSATGFIVNPQGFVVTVDHAVSRDNSFDDITITGAIGSLYAPGSLLRVVDEDKS